MRGRPGHRAVLVAAFCFAAAALAHADGGFFPPPVYKKPADIPAQRALIAFRDGKETLIVESAFSTEAKDVGWLIPLPAVPDNIQPASPGTLKTLSLCLQPDIVHFMPEWFFPLSGLLAVFCGLVAYSRVFGFSRRPTETAPVSILAAFILLLLAACGLLAFAGGMSTFIFLLFGFGVLLLACAMLSLTTGAFSHSRNMPSGFEMFLAIVALVFFAGLFLPHLGHAGSPLATRASTVGGTIERQVQVGNYEVTILRAQTPDALNDWLMQTGFMSVPAQGTQIVSDYIRNGWCFAAARLERTEGGLSTPHPIRFDFKAPQAVYPMRLTSLAGSSPELELFLVGDKAASAGFLAREFCDSYGTFQEEKDLRPGTTEWGVSRTFDGKAFYQDIGQPDVVDVLWPDCVVTKLSGRLRPDQMETDLGFSWSAPKPTRSLLFSQRGALAMATALGADAILLFIGGTLVLFGKRISLAARKWRYFLKLVLPGVAAAFLMSLLFFLCVPKVNVLVARSRVPLVEEVAVRLSERSLGVRPLPAGASVEDGLKLVDGMIPNGLKDYGSRNEFTGEPIVRGEASPGNYDVRKIDGSLYYIYYDRSGAMNWRRMSEPEKPH